MSASSPVTFYTRLAAWREQAMPVSADDGEIFYDPEWFETLANFGIEGADGLWLAHTGRLSLALQTGRQLTAFSNYYAALFGPMGGVVPTPAECAALAAALHADSRRWPVIRLQPLDADHPFCNTFAQALTGAGYRVDRYFCFGNWSLPVAGRDFATYRQSLPSRLQNTLRRAGNKLARTGTAEFHIQSAVDERLETAIAEFVDIYAASWKTPEPFPEFVPALCRLAARRGWLRLGLLRLDGMAVAGQVWLVSGGKASIFKLAYREGHESFSPGSLLTAELMRHALDVDAVREVDYLCGDDAYKRDWMSLRRERIGLVAFRMDSLAGRIAAARHDVGKWLRQRSIR